MKLILEQSLDAEKMRESKGCKRPSVSHSTRSETSLTCDKCNRVNAFCNGCGRAYAYNYSADSGLLCDCGKDETAHDKWACYHCDWLNDVWLCKRPLQGGFTSSSIANDEIEKINKRATDLLLMFKREAAGGKSARARRVAKLSSAIMELVINSELSSIDAFSITEIAESVYSPV